MPAKSYVENPNFGTSKPISVEEKLNYVNGMQRSATRKPGRRERFKMKMTKIWMGSKRLEDSGANEKSHHLRFWRNKESDKAALSLITQSAFPGSESPTLSYYSPPTSGSPSSATSVRSAEESVIYKPLGSPQLAAGEANTQRSLDIDERFTRICPSGAPPPSFEHSICSAASTKSAEFASGSSALSMEDGSEAFSPTANFGSGFTPITPMPIDGADSKYRAAEPFPIIITSLASPRHNACIGTPMLAIDDGPPPTKMANEDSIFLPTGSAPPKKLSSDLSAYRRSSLPPNFIMRETNTAKDGGLSVENSTKPGIDLGSNEASTPANKPETSKKIGGQFRCSQPKTRLNNAQVELGSKLWENLEEEPWFVKVLKDYCPVRFRKNKRLNFDSQEFRCLQSRLTSQALIEQEVRREDKKLIFRPNYCPNKSLLRRWLNFEEDKDILDSMDHFILCNEGSTPIFRGSRPAVRKHVFRQWLNFDRQRDIICEQLMERWSSDEQYLERLRRSRMKREEARAWMEVGRKNDDKMPPASFFVNRLVLKLTGKRSRLGKPPKAGSRLVVFKKEPLFGVPYFENKKKQVKRWVKDLLLGGC